MPNRTIPRDTLGQLLTTLKPDWTLDAARLADGGSTAVYHLDVSTPDGETSCVLKASHDGEAHGIGLEARLLARLGAETDIPVPEVYAALDAYPEVPTPAFLMERVPGEAVAPAEVGALPEPSLLRVARETGRHLAALHELDGVDAFGVLEPSPASTLRGGRPPGSPETVRVADPETDWPTCLGSWAERALDAHAESRFGDLTDEVRSILSQEVAALSGTFVPRLGRMDASLDDVLIDPETGAVNAMVDWASARAVPAAYDLVHVERSLAGGHWAKLPGAPDVRHTVRAELVRGYRERGDRRVIEQFEANHAPYDLLALVREMQLFDSWVDQHGLSDETREATAENYRLALAEWL